MNIEIVSIIGLGLIGGSLGMSLNRSKCIRTIRGFDKSKETCEEALSRRAVTEIADSLVDVVKDADIIIIAVPVEKISDIIKEISSFVKSGAIITDVASTKEYLAKTLTGILTKGVYYVGGHPMAGTEHSGIGAADPFLFQNAVYILTPEEETPQYIIDKLTYIVSAVGGIPYYLKPKVHDVMVGAISHLPHLIAAALVNTASKVNQEYSGTFALAAGGFRDSTRIALGSPSLWREILFTNRSSLINLIDIMQDELSIYRKYLDSIQKVELEQELRKAVLHRERLPKKNKGFLTLLHELVVVVEDKPGAIASVINILAEKGLNIKDIEILRVREGEAGTLRLAFENVTSLESAVYILSEKGFQVKARGEKEK